jgi:predicted AAA+ superfamily ATPase
LGQLAQSYVASQVLAAAEWAANSVELFHWRTPGAKPLEVDLVLRETRGRLVGVECKVASGVGPGDVAGLRALRKAKGLHRGFVVYGGTEVREADHNIWALPLSGLGH